jgi:hypothetical protein
MQQLLRTTMAMLALASVPAFAQSPTPPPLAPTPLGPPPVTPPAPLTAPPDGSLAIVSTSRRVDPNGNSVVERQSTYRDPRGVAQDQQTIQTTTAPPPPPVTTTTTTSSDTSTTVPH